MRLPTRREIYERLREKYSHVEGWNHQTGYAIATRERNAALAALSMQAQPDRPVANNLLPLAQSAGAGVDRYEYEVVVRWTRTNGEADSAVVTVTSDTPLSASAISQFAADQIDWTAYPSGRAGRQRAIGSALAGGEFSAEVISAHRTY